MLEEKEWLSVHKTGFRLLKLAYSMDRTFLPLCLLSTVSEVFASYAVLFLSAGLIDALIAGNFKKAAVVAGVLLFTKFLFGVLETVLFREYKTCAEKSTQSFFAILRKKLMDLDYETTENPELVDKIRFSERTLSMYGSMEMIVMSYKSILQNILSAGTAVVMVVGLCLKVPKEGTGVLGFFAGRPASLCLLFCMTAVLLLLLEKVRKISDKKDKEIFEQHTGIELKLGYLVQNVFMNYKTGKVTRLFDMDNMLVSNADTEKKKMVKYYEKSARAEESEALRYNLVNGFFTLSSYLLVALKTVTGAISVGAFTQYTGALAQFGTACSGIAGKTVALKRTCTYMGEFLDFLDMEEKKNSGTIPVEKRLDGEYELAFENVSFHYPGSDKLVLKNVNCRLNMKDKMAVVGRNGTGKTTFIKLLCRLYDPTEGRITLNGVDIRKYDEEEYRDLFGVVFQDFKLFSFPLWKNVAAGFPRDDEKLQRVLAQAGAEQFVAGLPNGVDTVLYKHKEEGVEISGGEAQKLALARALYKDAPVVILDEPTAALDPISEAEVYAGFDEMVKNKTSIYISHRMSSCRFCNDILVFADGNIVERGSHETLLEKAGEYAKLWTAQAKYYAGN